MSENCKALIIAIDGHSSTGKSTVAKIIAARLKYAYIDTGAMYRAVTLAAMRDGVVNGGEVDRERLAQTLKGITIEFRYNPLTGKNETFLNEENVEELIRGMEVSGNVSVISSVDFVRTFLVEKQREMGKTGGVVMDGRDIGSVVFPRADIKFFITAQPEVRAGRRYKELIGKGEQVSYEEVEENVRSRDYLDEHREVSPLKQTEDAILIDNSRMTVDEEVELMLRMVKEKC